MKIRQGFFKRKPSPKLIEAMQIEISSFCNLQCKFCPTTYINEAGEKNLMPLQSFQELQPYFAQAKWVYLQGWGEPLLNKDIWEMTRLVKESGAKVGFTTNGTLLTDSVINHLIRYQVDLVSVSIAGATAKTHESLRCGSNLQQIIDHMGLLVQEKERQGSSYPLISISYMLTKESVAELPRAVELAYKLGANDFYTTNLDYVFDEATNESKIYVWSGKPMPEYEKIIKETEKFARRKKFSFRTYPLSPEEEREVCDLNPAKLVFITSNGDVTPCPYLGRKLNPRYSPEGLVIWPRKVFGNIHTKTFSEIWQSAPYQEFRNMFLHRAEAYDNLIDAYLNGEKTVYKMKMAEEDYRRVMDENPLPKECRNCPKIYGI
jgi:MoaA/NifB/PqqE/SkfB family radical SAM enzyme